MHILLLIALSATDILIGVEALGIFWVVFVGVLIKDFYGRSSIVWWPYVANILVFSFLMMIISSLVNGMPKISSFGYAAMFVSYGLWLVVNGWRFDGEVVVRCFSIIILAYFSSIIIATALISVGIYDLNDYMFARVYFDVLGGDMRPIGFSSEPSYAAFILSFSWLALVRVGYISGKNKKNLILWTAMILISLQLLGSVYGYLLSLVILLIVAEMFSWKKYYSAIFFGIFLLTPLVFNFINTGESRFIRIISVILFGNMDEWLIEDSSSFFRFGPFFTYMSEINLFDYHSWIGNGASSASYFFGNIFREHINSEKMAIELGFFPAYLYDYGMVCAVIFGVFLYRITGGMYKFHALAMILLLLFNANFNTQVIWFAVTCLYLSMWVKLKNEKYN